jgi:NAD-dependent dihydropyrimidine dehydrogenase PreA subunit
MAKVHIDLARCEGKKDCVKICPEQVLAMREPDPATPTIARIKLWFHGGKQARVENEAACTACMKCVDACPEDAITVRT